MGFVSVTFFVDRNLYGVSKAEVRLTVTTPAPRVEPVTYM